LRLISTVLLVVSFSALASLAFLLEMVVEAFLELAFNASLSETAFFGLLVFNFFSS